MGPFERIFELFSIKMHFLLLSIGWGDTSCFLNAVLNVDLELKPTAKAIVERQSSVLINGRFASSIRKLFIKWKNSGCLSFTLAAKLLVSINGCFGGIVDFI